jgi:hypothetical protein
MEASAEATGLAEEASRWLAQHRPAIQVVMEAYLHSGVWPRVDELQQHLHAAGADLDLWSFSDALRGERRYGIGSVEPPDERIKLRLRAWHDLKGLDAYVSFVVMAVRTTARRYLDGSTVLAAADLRELQSLDDFSWRLIMGLIEQEAFYFLAGVPPLTTRDWECQIDRRRIGRFLNVTTAEDYLLAIGQLHVDAQPRVPAGPAGGAVHAPLRPYQREVPAVNIDRLTIQTAGMVNINPETVNVIQSHIEAIGPRHPELAQALARLTEALDAPEFSGEQREEMRAYVEDLSTDLEQPPERQRWSRIKASATAIAELARLAPKFAEAWNQVWGMINRT